MKAINFKPFLATAVLLLVSVSINAEVYSGDCGAEGDNVKWTYNSETRHLTISGTGKMCDYDVYYTPWLSHRPFIKKVSIEAGVTSIGTDAFYRCSNLTSITIPEGVTSIGRSAFDGCSSLTAINIPESVTSIGSSAFYGCTSLPIEKNLRYADTYLVGVVDKNLSAYDIKEGTMIIGRGAFNSCSNLTSINLPSSMKIVDSEAFKDCSRLTSITIPDGVTSIGESAFKSCSLLTSITIPSSVTSIGNSAFQGCSRLPIENNLRYADTYLIEAVDKSLSTYTIKEGTRFIGNIAFYGCSSLTSINIPDGVTSIGGDAFSGCSSLTSINIPSSVTSIGSSAFNGCSSLPIENNIRYADTYLIEAVDKSLSTYTIKEGTKFIGGSAFADCSSMTSITIPSSVTSIAESAFYNSYFRKTLLTSITVASGNTTYDSRNNCNAIIETSTNTLIKGCNNTVIPSGVMSIGNSAFRGCSSLTSITIPEGVTNIGHMAFWGCSGLTSITIPSSVTSIGNSAFSDCSCLTSVTIPKGVTSIGSSAFSGCSCLTSVTIPKSVTSIGNSAFRDCTNLVSASILGCISKLDCNSFYGCTNLTSLDLPSSVQEIGYGAFYNCGKLYSVSFSPQYPVYYYGDFQTWNDLSFYGCSSLPVEDNIRYFGNLAIEAIDKTRSSYTIREGTTVLSFIFYGNTYIRSVYLPSSLKVIGQACFADCSNLTNVKIPYGVNNLYEASFMNCTSLASITIPGSVTNIGPSAFRGCSGLTSLTIPEGVVSIRYMAFQDCTGLTNINIPESVIDIDESSTSILSGCTGIQNPVFNSKFFVKLPTSYQGSYEIPDGIETICREAFSGVNNLTSVTIPESVTIIGGSAFNCKNLSSVRVGMQIPPYIDPYTFSNRANATLYVPYGSKDAYEKATYWKDFKEIVEMPKVTSSLAISDASGLVGNTFNLPISMTNEDEITAMQFELCLPEGVSVASAALTDRKNGHSIDYTLQENGNYQFTVFSSSSKAIKGTEGDVANISLSISNSMAAGSYTIQIKSIELTTTSAIAILQSDLSATLTVSNIKLGDVNGDDKMSITDAVGIVNYILGNASSNFHPEAADVNGDGGISITDAVKIVNIILNQGSGVKERRTQEVENEREPQ